MMLLLAILILLQAKMPLSTPLPVLKHFNAKYDSVTALYKGKTDSASRAKWQATMKRYSKELSWPFKIVK
jgi:hypothetical protein